MAQINELKYLMDRLATNTCTREEFERLLALIDGAGGDEVLADAMRDCWDSIETQEPLTAEWRERFVDMLDRSARPEPVAVVPPNFGRWFIAAAVVLTLTAGYLGYRGREAAPAARAAVAARVTRRDTVAALAGADRNRAVLTLADGSVIALDTAARGTIANQGGIKIVKGSDDVISYHPGSKTASIEGYNTITTPKGGEYCIVLPDGTKVWLNAASSLRFPTGFGHGTREVLLTGEAFFDVTRNSHQPFHVKAGNLDVEVLGTLFNINAYKEEGRVATTLVQGKIRVARSSDAAASAGVLLKPGVQATLADNGTLTLDQAPDMDEVLAWKNGNFNFVNTPVPEILREIARWYDLEIVYEGAAPDKRLTGTFSRNVALEQLIDMLRYAGVNMRIEKNQLLILPE